MTTATLAPAPAPVPRPRSAPAQPSTGGIARLRGFVTSLAELLAATRSEAEILETGSKLLESCIQ
jgi:hypothetical protein